jgi:hypothetical protein
VLLIPLPATIGKEWKSKGETMAYEKKIESEDVHLPDQVYRRCLKIHSQGSGGGEEMVSDDYYADGIGLVKSVSLSRDKLGRDLALTLALRKYVR